MTAPLLVTNSAFADFLKPDNGKLPADDDLAAEYPERVAELSVLLKQIRTQRHSAPRLLPNESP